MNLQADVTAESSDAALSKAQDEARESLAESVRMEGAKSQLEAELRIAEGAREQALASADEARAATAALQSELGALRAQVTQSRESVSKAMGDVQAQVEQRKAAWNAERQELMEKLASAEERAQSLDAKRHELTEAKGKLASRELELSRVKAELDKRKDYEGQMAEAKQRIQQLKDIRVPGARRDLGPRRRACVVHGKAAAAIWADARQPDRRVGRRHRRAHATW